MSILEIYKNYPYAFVHPLRTRYRRV